MLKHLKFQSALLLALLPSCLVMGQVRQTVHPGYSLINLRPTGFEPKGIGGMDFLPDGRLAVCTWGGYQLDSGQVLLLTGVQGTEPEDVTIQTIARGLAEPLGLKVVNGEIYVMQRTELSRIPLPTGTGLSTPVRVVGGWKNPDGDWTYGGEVQGNFFYATQGGWKTADTSMRPQQGSWMQMSPSQGYQVLAGGLRSPNGLALGPEGQFFTTDNQGNWLPANKLIHLVPGRFYGCRNNARSTFLNVPETPPAVWLPQQEIGSSPSQPLLIPNGIYAGQLLAGDVNFGGVQRYFLEKVRSPGGSLEFQGAVFRFSGGLECGMNRMLLGADGSLYMGGVGGNTALGNLGGWNWQNTWTGLQKLVPNGRTIFDILAVRSLTDGFEIEFTKRVGSGATVPANYSAQQWRYVPTSAYGGPKVDLTTLTVQSATLSPDSLRVRLVLNGLRTGFVIYLRVPTLLSSSGEDLWTRQAWYTLNYLGPGVPTKVTGPHGSGSTGRLVRAAPIPGGIRFEVMTPGKFTLEILDPTGRKLGRIKGEGAGFYVWNPLRLNFGPHFYRLITDGMPSTAIEPFMVH